MYTFGVFQEFAIFNKHFGSLFLTWDSLAPNTSRSKSMGYHNTVEVLFLHDKFLTHVMALTWFPRLLRCTCVLTHVGIATPVISCGRQDLKKNGVMISCFGVILFSAELVWRCCSMTL